VVGLEFFSINATILTDIRMLNTARARPKLSTALSTNNGDIVEYHDQNVIIGRITPLTCPVATGPK
jgi:hypothetical protein